MKLDYHIIANKAINTRESHRDPTDKPKPGPYGVMNGQYSAWLRHVLVRAQAISTLQRLYTLGKITIECSSLRFQLSNRVLVSS